MSRSGLFRAAALLAASASPLLVGSANAAETPDLKGAPEAAAAEKVSPAVADASQVANPLDAAKGVKLPALKAPVNAGAPQVEAPEAPAAERSLPGGLPIGTLPKLPDTSAVPNAKIGDFKVPAASQLPGAESVQGQLPTLG